MKQLKWLVLALAFASCQKELSNEEGNLPEECIIDRISQIDTVAQASNGYVGVTFNNSNRAIRIEDYDSSNNAYLFDAPLTLKGDTVRVNAIDYYVVDPANQYRVKRARVDGDYFGITNTDLDFDYIYDASGYLLSKVSVVQGQEVLRFDYTWGDGDLRGIIAGSPLTGEIFYETDYSYYTDKPVNNFLYLSTDLLDASFDLALNFGRKSAHALRYITYIDHRFVAPVTTVTTFYNYQQDAENRVLSYVVDNEYLWEFGIYRGKNQVRYHCR